LLGLWGGGGGGVVELVTRVRKVPGRRWRWVRSSVRESARGRAERLQRATMVAVGLWAEAADSLGARRSQVTASRASWSKMNCVPFRID